MFKKNIYATYYNFVERRMERDNFMSPAEAKEFGIIDKVQARAMQEEEIESIRTSEAASIKLTTQSSV